jgi:hypothetical protein
MQYKLKEQFHDLPLKFDKGVAAIDVVSLKGAGNAIEPYIPSHNILLPPHAEYEGKASFEDLMQIKVFPEELSVVAIIDTKKMGWGPDLSPQRTAFDDYNSVSKRGVSFAGVGVMNHEGMSITRLPVVLYDGRSAFMWFAEVPQTKLLSSTIYGLFTLAQTLTTTFQPQLTETYDQLKLPAQQIDYQRIMDEIMQLNPSLREVKQVFKVALDETGARVYVETQYTVGLSLGPTIAPKIAVFGSKGPVVFWLTEPDEQKAMTPFAVVATTSEAWLDPSQEVDFSLGM